MTTNENPFPGLRPFESDETHLFFGRDGQSEELIRRLGRTRFLAVVGTSGSGKSSLVRAGLLPALQGGLMASAGSDWRVAMFRPGHDPVGNLARALASPEVFGAEDRGTAEMQAALTESTLRRSSLGLIDAVRQARVAAGPEGRPRLQPYENLLVVVDQFEELFRFRQLIEVENSKEDAAAFVRLLLEAARASAEKIYVVLTMRSDFLGDCAQFQGLPEAINEGQYLIPRMTRDERREAVVGPVAVGGGRITTPLVNQLLNDMGDNPDQLPILQHALMRTWDYWGTVRSDGEPIDLPHYQAIGGMSEALSRHAEEAYSELAEPGQEVSPRQRVAEKLFKALTEKGADNREIRRPLELHEACEIAEADESDVVAVVEAFRRAGRSFLMPPPSVALHPDSLVDISHESLIRNWTRLRKWTDEEAQSARIYKRLAETAVLHKAGEEALLKDPALQVALDWRVKNKPNAAWARRYHAEYETAMSFLDASVAARERELLERQQQQRREVSYKRTRLVAFLLAFSALLSVGSAVYAFRQGSVAERQRVVAEQQRNIAELKTAEALTQQQRAEEEKLRADDQTARAETERLAAVAARELAETQRHLADAEKAKAEEQRTRAEQQAALARASESKAIAAEARANQLAETNRQLLYPADMNLAHQAFEANNFDRAEELLAEHRPAAGEEPRFTWGYLWRLIHSEKKVFDFPSGSDFMALAPDGQTLLVRDNKRLERLDPSTGEKLPFPLAVPDPAQVVPLQLSPDGKTLRAAVADPSGESYTSLFIDTATGKVKHSISSEEHALAATTFAPDGKSFAWYDGEDVRLWDVDTLRELGAARPGYDVHVMAFSPDGHVLATGGEAPSPVVLWDARDLKGAADDAEIPNCGQTHALRLPCAITPITDDVKAMAFSPTERTLAIAFSDRSVWEWSTLHQGWGGKVMGSSDIASLRFSPDGSLLAIGYKNGSVRVHDASQLSQGVKLGGHQEAVTSLAFSGDGAALYTGSKESVRVWNVASAVRAQMPLEEAEGPGEGPGRRTHSIAFSPDGRTIAAAFGISPLTLWDVATRRPLEGVPQDVLADTVAFSPDGRTLAYNSSGGEVKLWDRVSSEEVTLEANGVNSLSYSPDSRLLITGRGDGTVALWDVSVRSNPKKLREVSASQSFAEAIAFSPDGKSVVACFKDGTVKMWDAGLGSEQTLAQAGTASDLPPATTLAFSPDGRLLAVGLSKDYDQMDERAYFGGGLVRLWRIKDEGGRRVLEELPPLKGHRGDITSLAFSPSGQTLYSSSDDGASKLWDTISFREVISVLDETAQTTAAAFSPDGRILASGDAFGNVRLLRSATKEEVDKLGTDRHAPTSRGPLTTPLTPHD
jgi:WD40 repeat protein